MVEAMGTLTALLMLWGGIVILGMVGPLITAAIINIPAIEHELSGFFGLFNQKLGEMIGEMSFMRWFCLLYGLKLIVSFLINATQSSGMRAKLEKKE